MSTLSIAPTGLSLFTRDFDGTLVKVGSQDYSDAGRAILEALARQYRNSFIITTFGKAPPEKQGYQYEDAEM